MKTLIEIVQEAKALAAREIGRHPEAVVESVVLASLPPTQAQADQNFSAPSFDPVKVNESAIPNSPWKSGERPEAPFANSLPLFEAQIQACQRCALGSSRKNFVFGTGDPKASLVFVGEAPGAEEDQLGKPFVGAAGKLLDKIIAAMGSSRDKVYICNVLKCRPPFNRDPSPEEVAACWPYLEHQLKLLSPKVICTLGKHATQTLLGREEGITQLRGHKFSWQGITVIPTYHPSALLRNEELKKWVWEDMKLVMSLLKQA